MAESYMHSNGLKIENCEHEEKTLWKKRMVQSHATADEMNTKFLSHLDLRFESLNKLPGQFNFFQSAIEELKPFIAQQIQKMSESLINEQRKSEARVSKQVHDVERDYTHKMEQISSQIYDMHKELQSVRGKIREDFLHADSNTHDKIAGVEEQCTKVAERLTDINCDTLSLNEKFTEMKDKIIDDRLAFLKQSEEMLRLKEGQDRILRLLRGPESLLSKDKKEKERPTNVAKRRSADSEDSRSCREDRPSSREDRFRRSNHDRSRHSSRQSSYERDSESRSSHHHRGPYKPPHRSHERRPFVNKRDRRSHSPGPGYNNNNSRTSNHSHYSSQRSRS